jgi:hypothetical protein
MNTGISKQTHVAMANDAPNVPSPEQPKHNGERFQRFCFGTFVALVLFWRFESVLEEQNKKVIGPAQLKAIEEGLHRLQDPNRAPLGLPKGPPPGPAPEVSK